MKWVPFSTALGVAEMWVQVHHVGGPGVARHCRSVAFRSRRRRGETGNRRLGGGNRDQNLDKVSLEVTRVGRQSLPETPSLDDNRAGILEVNPLAHTTAKPDAEADCGRAVQRVTLKGGTSHWRLRNCGPELPNFTSSTQPAHTFSSSLSARTRDGGITKFETPQLAPGKGRLEERSGQR